MSAPSLLPSPTASTASSSGPAVRVYTIPAAGAEDIHIAANELPTDAEELVRLATTGFSPQ